MTFLQLHGHGGRRRVVQRHVIDDQLFIQPHPIHGSSEANLVGAGFGGREKPGPSHSKIRDTGWQHQRGRIRMETLKIHILVHTRQHWRALEVFPGEVLCLQAWLSVAALQYRSGDEFFLTQEVHSRNVVDLGGSKLLPDTIQSRGRTRWRTVVVTLQYADRLSERPNDGDFFDARIQRQYAIIL